METATLETVAKSVHDLSEAVTEMQAGLVDKTKVEEILKELLEAQRQADIEQNRARGGFRPDDDTDDPAVQRQLLTATGRDRMYEILTRPAEKVAPLIRRPVSDVAEFQARADQLQIMAAILKAQGRIQGVRDLRYFREEYLPIVQAMDSTTAAEGDEFVPTELSPRLIERVNLALRVAALWPAVQMPSNPWDVPGRATSRTRLGKIGEQTADTGQTGFKKVTPGTRKVTLTAVKFAGEALFSKELDEDGLIAIFEFVEDELIDYLAADIEDTLINGDATGAHMDSDSDGATDVRKNWDGIRNRVQAGAKTDASSASALTTAHLLTNRVKMGKYGVSIADLVHIISINSYLQLLSDTNVQTVDKYGPSATILTGELGKSHGVPLIVSEYVRTDLNATGVYDGVTTTETVAATVNTKGFMRGVRREQEIQVLRELYAEYDQDAITISTRQAFESRFPAAELTSALTYNVDK